MATTYTITAPAIASHDMALAAGVITAVTFTTPVNIVEIVTDGAAKAYYTLDGSDPTVGGSNTRLLAAGTCVDSRNASSFDYGTNRSITTVKIISAGTPTISVQRG